MNVTVCHLYISYVGEVIRRSMTVGSLNACWHLLTLDYFEEIDLLPIKSIIIYLIYLLDLSVIPYHLLKN
jgi:hypothetical protein